MFLVNYVEKKHTHWSRKSERLTINLTVNNRKCLSNVSVDTCLVLFSCTFFISVPCIMSYDALPNDLEDYKATNNYSHMNKKLFWRNCSIEISLEFPPTGDKKLHASLHRILHERHMP